MASRLRPSETVLKSKRRHITVAEKIRILKAVEAAAPDKQGAVLRREGIYSSQVPTRRRQLEFGDLDQATLRKRVRIKDESKAADHRIAVHAGLGPARLANRHAIMRGAFEKHPDRFVRGELKLASIP